MESSSQEKKEAPLISLQPNETVLTAFPFGPHSSLLDFLKGEPKILGGIQILLAVIIVSLGIIFAFSYISVSKIFPLVFLSGYPFWGALIFFLTGSLTVTNEKLKNHWIRGIVTMNVISSLVAVTGITLIIISYTQQHKFCQTPSIEGPCALGRTLFVGLLSVLLIITIVELGISVTIASFRSKCWTSSDEVVFFLPSDVTQNSEQPAPEENDGLVQFKLQEESSTIDTTSNKQAVFFGGYAFFKLKVLRTPFIHQCRLQTCNKCKDSYYTSSEPVLEEKSRLKPLHTTLQTQSADYVTLQDSAIGKLSDRDLQYALAQPHKLQTQSLRDRVLPLKVFQTRPAQKLQALPTDDLPPKRPVKPRSPVKATQSDTPSSHISQSLDLTSEDLPSEYMPVQEKPSQDTLYQGTSSTDTTNQYLAPQTSSTQVTSYEDSQFFSMDYADIQQPYSSLEPQSQTSSEILYQDIQTEVMEQTQEWNAHKPPRRFSLYLKSKRDQSPKRYSLDLQSQGIQRRKSLDKHIKAWLSPKRHSISKRPPYHPTTEQLIEQPAEELQAEGELSPKEQLKDQEDKEQQMVKEQFPKKQPEVQQPPQEKSPKRQSQTWQGKDQEAQMAKSSKQERHVGQLPNKQSPQLINQNWQTFDKQADDRRSKGWENKDLKAQEWQSEAQHSTNRETQNLLEIKAVKPEALHQEVPGQNTSTQYNLDKQFQDKGPNQIQPRVVLKDAMQRRKSWRDQNSTNPQSEDVNPDCQLSSCQSLVQDTYSVCLSNIDSEQEVQQNASVSSNSYKDLHDTYSSCYPKDQQQSEDSD